MPIQNMARHAVSAGSTEKSTVKQIAAMPHPTAHPPCTVPTALPRCCARMASPISTEPTAHSPPKPRPCRPRVISSCQNELVNPLRNVKNANHRMVICRMRARPKRSASNPASQPPTAEISRAAVPSMPACPLLMCHAAISGNDEAVDHHVHAVQCPAAEGCDQSAALSRREFEDPSPLVGGGCNCRLGGTHTASLTGYIVLGARSTVSRSL